MNISTNFGLNWRRFGCRTVRRKEREGNSSSRNSSWKMHKLESKPNQNKSKSRQILGTWSLWLVNTSPKGLDEKLHRLREINEKWIQNGVFDIFPKHRSWGARDFQWVSTRLRGLKSHQRFPRIQETSGWSPQNQNTSKREKSSTKSKRGGKGRSDQHKGESLSTKLIFD